MALTLVRLFSGKTNNRRFNLIRATFDSSYPTGGEPLTAAQLGLRTVDAVVPIPAAGYIGEYDEDNAKLKAFTPTLAQSAHAHSPTAITLRQSLTGADIKGSANTDAENADQNALPTNGALVGTLTAIAAGAYTFPATAHPDRGRNVCIAIYNDSGGPLDLFEGVSTFAVTGTWRGAAQTENITITSSGANKAVANTKYRYKYGNRPFDTVTAVAVTNMPADGLKIGVGIGSKIGLPADLATPAEADVVKITKNAAHQAVSGTVDTTNMTVNLGALSDNDDFTVVYKVTNYLSAIATGGAISAAAASEVADTTDLSTLSMYLLAFGL